MAWAVNKRNLPIILLLTGLLVSHISKADRNISPTISLSLPYSGKLGVLILSEETPQNSLLGIMETKDENNGAAGDVECTTDNPYISIPLMHPKTYKINLAAQVDRETASVVKVSILCSDKGTPSMTATALFTIEVTDINDNAPIFGESSYSVTVTEGVEIGTHVATVTALDPDSEPFAIVHYSLLDDDGGARNFTVNETTGQIFTNIEIDREAVSKYIVTIVAKDSGIPSLSSKVEVSIYVQDINDNAPVILTTEIHVRESQKSMENVGTIFATDADVGKNAELVFSKVENSKSMSNTPFLVQANGSILSVVTLDREQRPQYAMEVTVRDKGNPRYSSNATITIIVDDVNDNSPIIVSPCFYDDSVFNLWNSSELTNDSNSDNGFVSIDWYSPEDNKVVYKVEAEDEDTEENSQLVFSIQPITHINMFNATLTSTSTNDPLFKINEITGEIFLRRFVRRNDHLTQILNVSVTDKGSPSLSSHCAIHVTINIDPAHFTTQKPPKVKPKPTKKLRKNTNGGTVLHILGTRLLAGSTGVLLSSVLTYIVMSL